MDSAWGERCVSGDRVSLDRPTVFRFQSEDVAVCDQSVGCWSSRHATIRARPMNPGGPRGAVPTNYWRPTQMLSRTGYTLDTE